jgi:hypothetical protein
MSRNPYGTNELYLWTKIFVGRQATRPLGNQFVVDGDIYRELAQLIKDLCDFDLNETKGGDKLNQLSRTLKTKLEDGSVDTWLASHNGLLQRRDPLMFYFFLETSGGIVKYVLEQHFGSDYDE